MLFKNAKFAKLNKFDLDYDALQEKLKEKAYVPATPSQETSIGWVSPFGDDAEVMSLTQGNSHLLKLKIEEKKVPASAINEEVSKKIKALREKDPSIKIDKAQRANMKEEVKFNLLPKVLPNFSYIELYVDMDNKLVVFNGTSDNKWEIVVSHLTEVAGDDFDFDYFDPENDPSDEMTRWIADWDIPADFVAGSECKLKGTGEEKTEISYKKHDLRDEKISNYLSSMKISKLALELEDEISFTIDGALVLSGIKFLDVYREKRKEDLGSVEDEASRHKMELDVDFAIMRGAFADFLPKVVDMFKDE